MAKDRSYRNIIWISDLITDATNFPI